MNAIYRLLPLLMFVCLCLMLWQYVSGAKDGILDFLAAIRWYLLAAFFLMLALLRAVWLHAHDRAPTGFTGSFPWTYSTASATAPILKKPRTNSTKKPSSLTQTR